MNRRRWIIGIIAFIFVSIGVYAFANTGGGGLQDDPTQTVDPNNPNNPGNNGGDNPTNNPGGEGTLENDPTDNPAGGGAGGGGRPVTGDPEITYLDPEYLLNWVKFEFGFAQYNAALPGATVKICKEITNGSDPSGIKPVFIFEITGTNAQLESYNSGYIPLVFSGTNKNVDENGCVNAPNLGYGSYTVREVTTIEGVKVNEYYEYNNLSTVTYLNNVRLVGSETQSLPGVNGVTFTVKNESSEVVITAQNDPAYITISKTGRNQILAGATLQYSVTITNTGKATAKDVLFQDIPGANLTLINANKVKYTLIPKGTLEQNIPALIENNAITANVNTTKFNNNILEFTLPELAEGEQLIVTYEVRAAGDVTSPTQATNEACFYEGNVYRYTEADEDDNCSTSTTIITPDADVAIVKSRKVDNDIRSKWCLGTNKDGWSAVTKACPVYREDLVTYRLTVTNQGNSPAVIKQVTDLLDEYLSLQAITNIYYADSNDAVIAARTAGKVKCEKSDNLCDLITIDFGSKIGDIYQGITLGAKKSVVIEFTAEVSATAVSQQAIKNGATVFFQSPLKPELTYDLPSNDVYETVYAPNVSINKYANCSDAQIAAGAACDNKNDNVKAVYDDYIMYTIKVSNNGNAEATNVAVKDYFNHNGSNLTSVVAMYDENGNEIDFTVQGTGSGQYVEWTNLTIGANSYILLKLKVQVDAYAPLEREIKNFVEVITPDCLENCNSTVINKVANPKLHQVKSSVTNTKASILDEYPELAKYVDETSIITYTIKLSNYGRGPAKGVKIYDYVPEGTELVIDTFTGVSRYLEGTTTVCTKSVADKKCVLTWNIGTLTERGLAGSNTSVSFEVVVLEGRSAVREQITNQAFYSADNSKDGNSNKVRNPLINYDTYNFAKKVIDYRLTKKETIEVNRSLGAALKGLSKVERESSNVLTIEIPVSQIPADAKAALDAEGATYVTVNGVEYLNIGTLYIDRPNKDGWVFTYELAKYGSLEVRSEISVYTANTAQTKNCIDRIPQWKNNDNPQWLAKIMTMKSPGTTDPIPDERIAETASACIGVNSLSLVWETEHIEWEYYVSNSSESFYIMIEGSSILGRDVKDILKDNTVDGKTIIEFAKNKNPIVLPKGNYTIYEVDQFGNVLDPSKYLVYNGVDKFIAGEGWSLSLNYDYQNDSPDRAKTVNKTICNKNNEYASKKTEFPQYNAEIGGKELC